MAIKPLKTVIKKLKQDFSPKESLIIPLLIAIFNKAISFVNYSFIYVRYLKRFAFI